MIPLKPRGIPIFTGPSRTSSARLVTFLSSAPPPVRTMPKLTGPSTSARLISRSTISKISFIRASTYLEISCSEIFLAISPGLCGSSTSRSVDAIDAFAEPYLILTASASSMETCVIMAISLVMLLPPSPITAECRTALSKKTDTSVVPPPISTRATPSSFS